MPGAGDLRDRYRFEQRALDDNGDRLGAWGDSAYTCAAATQYLHGSEAVQAQRLQGVQPVVLTIRACTAAQLIAPGWRAVDARDATRVFAVTAAELTPDRAWVQVLATIKAGQPNV